jgi:hypothetical protein
MRQLRRSTREMLTAWFAILLVLTVFGMAVAHAETRWTWSPVTEYTDGTPIPAEDAVSYRVEWARCIDGAFPVSAEGFQLSPAGTSSATSVEDFGPGLWCFRLFAITAAGIQSDPTATVTKRIDEPPPPDPKRPKPPTGVTIQ